VAFVTYHHTSFHWSFDYYLVTWGCVRSVFQEYIICGHIFIKQYLNSHSTSFTNRYFWGNVYLMRIIFISQFFIFKYYVHNLNFCLKSTIIVSLHIWLLVYFFHLYSSWFCAAAMHVFSFICTITHGFGSISYLARPTCTLEDGQLGQNM
jgi:hypothetical protein